MRTSILVSLLALVTLDLGCSRAASTAPDAGPLAAPSDGGTTPTEDAGPPAVLAITLSPLTLTPDFSASISDYYVRCAVGANPVTLAVTDTSGTQSTAMVLTENQVLRVRGQYSVRCLPHDFPAITVTHGAGGLVPTPGWYLLNGSTYAMVLDTNGTPVWYSSGTSVTNVDALSPNAISFTPNGTAPYGFSSSTVFQIHTLGVQEAASVSAVGSPTDVHEFRLLPNGDHLLWSYPIESGVDLTGLQKFGTDETMADCEIQEIDPSGRLVWSWLASDHVDPVQESIEPAVNPLNEVSVVDVFHFNSIDVDATGNLLLSARHANALFYVDRSSGRVLWKLGGSTYNKDGATYVQVMGDSQSAFNMQHDARFLPNGDVSVFDDHGATAGVARGVEYAIDHASNMATPTFQFLGSAQAQFEGSFRRYPDGESVVGWGYVATDPRVLTEIDASGRDVLDLALGGQASYRAVKVPLSVLDIELMRAAVDD